MSTDNASPSKDQALRGYENSLPIALLRTREMVMARFRPHLSAHGITEQQWRTIRALAEYDAIDATTLSDICCIMMPSLSRILKTLEKDGKIHRHKAKDDGRRQVISLTPEGLALFQKMAPTSAQIYKQIEQEVGADTINALVTDLRALQSNIAPVR